MLLAADFALVLGGCLVQFEASVPGHAGQRPLVQRALPVVHRREAARDPQVLP